MASEIRIPTPLDIVSYGKDGTGSFSSIIEFFRNRTETIIALPTIFSPYFTTGFRVLT